MAYAGFVKIIKGNKADIQTALTALIALSPTILSVDVKANGFVKGYLQTTNPPGITPSNVYTATIAYATGGTADTHAKAYEDTIENVQAALTIDATASTASIGVAVAQVQDLAPNASVATDTSSLMFAIDWYL